MLQTIRIMNSYVYLSIFTQICNLFIMMSVYATTAPILIIKIKMHILNYSNVMHEITIIIG